MARPIPRNGELFRHFKNKMYQIIAVAIHSETREQLVIYQALYGEYKTYARPLDMFMSEVDHEKYPEVTQKYRFTRVRLTESGDVVTVEEAPCQEDASPEMVESQNVVPDVTEHSVVQDAADPQALIRDKSIEEKMMSFFDADSWDEKYNLVVSMRDEINDHIIDSLAVSLDTIIADGPIQKRYEDLKYTIRTHQKYEFTNRLR